MRFSFYHITSLLAVCWWLNGKQQTVQPPSGCNYRFLPFLPIPPFLPFLPDARKPSVGIGVAVIGGGDDTGNVGVGAPICGAGVSLGFEVGAVPGLFVGNITMLGPKVGAPGMGAGVIPNIGLRVGPGVGAIVATGVGAGVMERMGLSVGPGVGSAGVGGGVGVGVVGMGVTGGSVGG